MSNQNTPKPISGLDIAKKLNLEKDYNEALLNEDIRKNYENVMTGEFTQFDNLIVETDGSNEKES